jgi:hypothetical protein
MSTRTALWLSLATILVLSSSPATAEDPLNKKLPALLKAKPIEPAPGDDELRKLRIARFNAAAAETRARYEEYQHSGGDITPVLEAARRLVSSRLALDQRTADEIAFCEQFLELAREVEKIYEHRFRAGTATKAMVELGRYHRLDAEIQLLHVKRNAAAVPKEKAR